MLKKFVSSLLAIVLLCGCGSSNTKSINVEETAKSLVSTLGMEDHMDPVKERVVNGLFFFEDGVVEESSVYLANNKSADVVAVFKANKMDECKKCAETYLSTLKEMTLSYSPDEMFKIDNAIIDDNGEILILVVTSDIEQAKSKVAEILGKK